MHGEAMILFTVRYSLAVLRVIHFATSFGVVCVLTVTEILMGAGLSWLARVWF